MHLFFKRGGRFAEIENGVDYNVNTHKTETRTETDTHNINIYTYMYKYMCVCLIEPGYIALLLGAVENLAYFVLISGWQIVFLFRLGFF